MNPQAPVLPDPDVPGQNPLDPVKEPPAIDEPGPLEAAA